MPLALVGTAALMAALSSIGELFSKEAKTKGRKTKKDTSQKTQVARTTQVARRAEEAKAAELPFRCVCCTLSEI